MQQLIDAGNLHTVIRIEGDVTQDELRRIYAESTIFALPCSVVDNGDRDGIPNVLAEAMATALPVISTHISGILEIVEHGVNGLLVPQKNAVALADALETLLLDPALRRRLGQAARVTITEIFDSWQTTVALRTLFTEQLAMHQATAATAATAPRPTVQPLARVSQ